MASAESAVDSTGRGSYELNHDAEAEAEASPGYAGKRGGWITFPFIAVTVLGLTIAASGWLANLTVYLIEKFNMKSIQAAQVTNIVNGSSNFFPIAGAIIADSFLGNFLVISVSSLVSLLGLVLLTLSASLHSLRPPQCKPGSETCDTPSGYQLAVLYSAITLVSLGMGGTRFTIATMGANQFGKAKQQDSFFNWFFVILYMGSVTGLVAIVYIEDNVSWVLGFSLCLFANVVGLAVFLVGKGYYRRVKPEGSPFTSLARVVVAAFRKKKLSVSAESKDYYFGLIGGSKLPVSGPTTSFRFLNRAAMKTEHDIQQNGQLTESWSLCTVQQVEDLKTLVKIFPLWSTSIFLSTTIGIQGSLMVLQALSMDRHLTRHVTIPAGTFLVSTFVSTAISLTLFDRFIFPLWKKLTRHSMTPLQRIGFGHVLNIIGMVGSALVEARRLHIARLHPLGPGQVGGGVGAIVPMSAFWLVAPLAIIGIGEALHFPGQVALYYQEFPVSLKSTATAMISLLVAAGFYLSTAVIDLIQRVTSWLPDNINEGRVDNVFWVLVVIGVINFGYYLVCSVLYKYKNAENSEEKI